MTDESSYAIYIKNIPYAISPNELSDWCSGFGPVTKCAIPVDRFGNSRGFAFVTFSTIEGYNRICKNNRLITIKNQTFCILSI